MMIIDLLKVVFGLFNGLSTASYRLEIPMIIIM